MGEPPVLIHFTGVFHDKSTQSTILGYPHLLKPPYRSIERMFFSKEMERFLTCCTSPSDGDVFFSRTLSMAFPSEFQALQPLVY